MFRVLVVAALAATVLVSWPLWQPRSEPPTVPLLALPPVSVGMPLLFALALSLWRPGAGCVVLAAIFAYAATIDQTRLQPEIVSLLFLLAATTAAPGARLLGRVHLVTLWFYAGFHKLLSQPFMSDERPWLLWNLLAEPPEWLAAVFPGLVVCTEIGLAAAAAVPRARFLAPWWALALHGGILAALMPHYNPAVWPWNLTLAASGFFLIAGWNESLLTELRRAAPALRVAVAGIALYPLGFQAGIVDPYLAHSLYAKNVPAGFVCREDGGRMLPRPGLNSRLIDPARGRDCLAIDLESAGLGVPAPPRMSFLDAYFRRDCRPGEVLLVLPPPHTNAASDAGLLRSCPSAP